MNTQIDETQSVLSANQTLTENGAITYSTSMSSNVDLFFAMGASRGNDISELYTKAYTENPEAATRILLWGRDARQGAGERQQFRNLFAVILKNDIEFAARVLARIPELGRWDDVWHVAFNTPLEINALRMIAAELREGNGLCAKWMPRPAGKQGFARKSAGKIAGYLKMTPGEYRKYVVNLTNVVEQFMCAGKWSDIEFGKLPSVASARLQKAFMKHDPVSYSAYLESLQKGEDKINAGAVYPYDITKSVRHGVSAVADQQWKALPDYLNGSDANIMPVIDVSGSMTCPAGRDYKSNTSCMDVAVSLGLYLCERNTGKFQDTFMTFSAHPQVVRLKGKNLTGRVNEICRADWGFNTDLMATFTSLLTGAEAFAIPESDMPSVILILSDMEFDSCVSGGRDESAMNTIRAKYEAAGYKLPQVVFWNIQSRSGGKNVPVKFNEIGTALVSGFSPSIMTSVLRNLDNLEGFTPMNIMLDTINSDRYNF